MKTKLELAVSYIEKCKAPHFENHVQECFALWRELYGKKFADEVQNKLALNSKKK